MQRYSYGNTHPQYLQYYDWVTQEGTKNEKRGRAAYLQNMYVEQNIDRFVQRFAEEEAPDDEDELPFK